MESAKDVGKNVEVNEYQEALEVFCDNTKLTQFNINQLQWASETLQELVDKATPKKPIVEVKETKYKKSTIHEHNPHCPICNTRLFLIGACCPNNECRQAIDWSKDE